MNRLVKLLLVFALTTISYGAFSQVEQKLQTVIQKSVHRYNVTLHSGNMYTWVIKKETTPGIWVEIDATSGSFSFVKDYTDPSLVVDVTDVADLNEVFILWNEGGNYKVILREINHTGDGSNCYDAVENEKIQPVTVNANDFEVTITAQATTCASTEENTIEFTVTKTNGKAANWKFKYQVSFDGAVYGPEQEYEVEYGTDANVYVLPLTKDIPEAANGDNLDYLIKVKLISATDGYNTPANNLETEAIEVTATVHKLAKTSEIFTD